MVSELWQLNLSSLTATQQMQINSRTSRKFLRRSSAPTAASRAADGEQKLRALGRQGSALLGGPGDRYLYHVEGYWKDRVLLLTVGIGDHDGGNC